jgi:hypothetical protein
MAKGSDMGRLGIGIPELSDYGFGLLRFVTQNLQPTPAGKHTPGKAIPDPPL